MPATLFLLALLGVAAPIGPDVVVSAAPPVDGQRLGDAMRAYFGDARLRIEIAPPPLDRPDLRQELAEARGLGEGTRALAVVRVRPRAGGADTIEIEIVDLATDKVVLAAIPRAARDADLYRALALKIQALLRATLSEAPDRIEPRSALAGIAGAGPSASSSPSFPPARATLETGYALFAFPLGGPVFHGLAVRAGHRPRAWLDLSLGVALLGAERDEVGAVTVSTRVLPLAAAARLRLEQGRFELLAGPSAALALVSVTPASDSVAVRPSRDLLVMAGAELEGRLRLGEAAWLFTGLAVRGVVQGARYTVEGTSVADTSRLQLTGTAGIGVRLW